MRDFYRIEHASMKIVTPCRLCGLQRLKRIPLTSRRYIKKIRDNTEIGSNIKQQAKSKSGPKSYKAVEQQKRSPSLSNELFVFPRRNPSNIRKTKT